MTRPVSRRLAACLVAGLLTAVLPLVAASPAVAADETPLQVSMTSLTPSAIPARGPITVTGQITNTSDETWTDLKVYLLTSPSPFLEKEDLVEASATQPTLEIGPRLTDTGLFDEIGDLTPGSSTDYSLSVPRNALKVSGEPGVYWLGVHVLGTNEDGRIAGADGRARTFIPLMPRRAPKTTLSLVVPIKGRVLRDPDGRLADLERWHELLSPEGRLGRLLELSGTSLDFPLTWAVDPAVLDAAQSAALDNPPIDTGPTDGVGEDPSGPPSAGQSPDPSAEATDGAAEEPAELSGEALQSGAWLRTFRRQATQHTVLAVPYADTDVAAILRHDFDDIYERATELSADTMDRFEIEATPVVAPPSGLLPEAVLRGLDPDTPVLLSDRAAPDAERPVVEAAGGRQLVLTDSGAGSGGPPPTPSYSALAVRQRVLSAAALHALSDSRKQPLVVSMPQSWDPGSNWRIAEFFAGLDVGWLSGIDIPDVLAGGSLPPGDERLDEPLAYPRAERRAEIPVPNLSATADLSHTGDVFADLLTRNETVDRSLAKSAMLGSSTNVRQRARAAAALTRETTAGITGLMEKVAIDGPSFVTMSSETGTLTVTLINDLDEPVTVGISADIRGEDLRIRPSEPVALGPGNRATVRLRATSDNIGVYSVTLAPTTTSGATLGNTTTFSVRSSQVGIVIWVIMGLGAAVLVVASGVRITKRVRARRSTHAPVPGSAPE